MTIVVAHRMLADDLPIFLVYAMSISLDYKDDARLNTQIATHR